MKNKNQRKTARVAKALNEQTGGKCIFCEGSGQLDERALEKFTEHVRRELLLRGEAIERMGLAPAARAALVNTKVSPILGPAGQQLVQVTK